MYGDIMSTVGGGGGGRGCSVPWGGTQITKDFSPTIVFVYCRYAMCLLHKLCVYHVFTAETV